MNPINSIAKFCADNSIDSSTIPHGTKIAEGLYDMDKYLGQVLTQPVKENYTIMGVAEAGVNNRAFCFYSVQEHLALFIQIPLDQAMGGDGARQRQKITNTLAAVKTLFTKVQEKNGKIEEGKRMLVVVNDLRKGSGSEWIQGQPGEIDNARWVVDKPLLQALKQFGKI